MITELNPGLPLKEAKVANKKFKAEKTPDLLSPKDAVIFIRSEDDEVEFRCSKQCVKFSGNLSFSSRQDLEDFAKLVSDAWKFHLSLK